MLPSGWKKWLGASGRSLPGEANDRIDRRGSLTDAPFMPPWHQRLNRSNCRLAKFSGQRDEVIGAPARSAALRRAATAGVSVNGITSGAPAPEGLKAAGAPPPARPAGTRRVLTTEPRRVPGVPVRHPWRVRLNPVVSLAVLLMVAPACRAESTSNQGARRAEHRYAVLHDGAWRLQEAVDPPPDDHGASIERPPLDWYAEYVPATSSSGQALRLSGHQASFHRARSELEDLGFILDEVDVENWTGVGGTTAESGARPTLVLLHNGRSSLMLLSYEIELGALTRLAGAIETVDEKAWTDGGGVVR